MLNIDQSTLFGKGHHRECYVHPQDSSLCIKIIVDDKPNDRQVKREKNYYKHLQKRNVSFEMVPRYHGDVETNMGPGSVFDMITDHNGEVSKTLEYYLSSSKLTEENYEGLSRSFAQLKTYLIRERIITMTLAARNIVCQRDKSGIIRFSVIDNIGNSDFIPICNYIGSLARRKIIRRWKRFEKRLLAAYPDNKPLHSMIKEQ